VPPRLRQKFHGGGSLTSNDVGMVVGVEDGVAGLQPQFLNYPGSFGERRAGENDLSTTRPGLRNLHGRGIPGENRRGMQSVMPGGMSDGESVVADA
jgi:hypothetical protein